MSGLKLQILAGQQSLSEAFNQLRGRAISSEQKLAHLHARLDLIANYVEGIASDVKIMAGKLQVGDYSLPRKQPRMKRQRIAKVRK